MSDFLTLVRTTLGLYVAAMRGASLAFLQNPWLALLLPLYSAGFQLLGMSSFGLGMGAGLLRSLLLAACLSSILALFEVAVMRERIVFGELGQSFGRYLQRVIGVLFLFWIVRLLLGQILNNDTGLFWLVVVVNIAIFCLCNPLPEMIYLTDRDGTSLIEESISFVLANAFEWLIPVAVMLLPLFALGPQNVLPAVASLGPAEFLPATVSLLLKLFPGGGPIAESACLLLGSALVVWIMLFRGFLFRALYSSGRRQRIFEARARGL
jgi:hypothetical protein